MMDGIILIDKPQGYTSFDVVARMKGMLGTRKVGHAGTLDPMATGVLPIFVERATKCCDILPNQNKTYLATFQLGLTTDTQDITGMVLGTSPVTAKRQQVEEMLEQFKGKQQQLPPMYSAVQINGKRLYDLARQGIEVERAPRSFEVYSLLLTSYNEAEDTYTIEVACSKGTYIRTLCHDLGARLGCGAVLTALRRTVASGFRLEDCIPLEEAHLLAGQGKLWDKLLPVEQAFASFPEVILSQKQARMLQNGIRLDANKVPHNRAYQGIWRVKTQEGQFIATAHFDPKEQVLVTNKLFVTEGVKMSENL